MLPPFPENRGARLRISGGCPARGEPEALTKLCSSIACRAQPCQRCSPVLQALIMFQMYLYGSASAEPFFVAPFPENRGARLRISGGCPARGEPEALTKLCSSIACRAQPCQRCSPVLQALIIFQMQLYGSASQSRFCCPPFPENRGTTAHLRRLPRKGRAGGADRSLLKHRVQGAALPAMLPSSPSADYISDATLRLCFGRAVFCCPFPGEQGSTTAHLRRLPRKGRAGGAQRSLLKHRVLKQKAWFCVYSANFL